MDIMGKLYTNSPVIDFPKDNLGLMYEKLILVGAFAIGIWRMGRTVLPYFQGEFGDFLASGLDAGKMEEENEKITCQSGVLCAPIA